MRPEDLERIAHSIRLGLPLGSRGGVAPWSLAMEYLAQSIDSADWLSSLREDFDLVVPRSEWDYKAFTLYHLFRPSVLWGYYRVSLLKGEDVEEWVKGARTEIADGFFSSLGDCPPGIGRAYLLFRKPFRTSVVKSGYIWSLVTDPRVPLEDARALYSVLVRGENGVSKGRLAVWRKYASGISSLLQVKEVS